MTSQLATILSGISSIFVIIFSIWAYILKNNEDSVSKIEFENKLTEKTNKIQELNSKIIDLQNEGIKELKHQSNMITGGSSYPLLVLFQNEEKKFIWSASLFITGSYPLKNFSYEVSVTQNGVTLLRGNNSTDLRQSTFYSVGDLVDLRKDANTKISLRFFANNGTWNQLITFRKNNNSKYEYKSELKADNVGVINKKGYEEDIKFGNFSGVESIKYKPNKT